MFAVSEEKIEISLTSVLPEILEALARSVNINTIRIHSERKGMDKLLDKNGYKFQENIFIKRIN
jgi:hypothetical protein